MSAGDKRGLRKGRENSLINLPRINVRIPALIVRNQTLAHRATLMTAIRHQNTVLAAGLPAIDLLDVDDHVYVVRADFVVLEKRRTGVGGKVEL